jgi:hypothetical protein
MAYTFVLHFGRYQVSKEATMPWTEVKAREQKMRYVFDRLEGFFIE